MKCVNVPEMLAQLTVSQFDNWFWHHQIKPFGFDWEDIQQASARHLQWIIAANGKTDVTPTDFLFNQPTEKVTEKSPDEIKATIRGALKVRRKDESK